MKNVKGQLTQRDITLIEYCLAHLPISSEIAAALFYPNKYIAQRRLNTIHNLKQLKRTERLVVNQPYIYYFHKKMAVKLNTGYLQTTREQIPGVEYLYFTESHSHATEQKLVKDDLDKELDRFEQIGRAHV